MSAIIERLYYLLIGVLLVSLSILIYAVEFKELQEENVSKESDCLIRIGFQGGGV